MTLNTEVELRIPAWVCDLEVKGVFSGIHKVYQFDYINKVVGKNAYK